MKSPRKSKRAAITDRMVKAMHTAFHVEWWDLKPGAVCTDTCGVELEKALRLALEAALRARRAPVLSPTSEIFALEMSKKDSEIAQLKKYNTEANEALARAIATIGSLALRIKNMRQASPKKYSCVICHQPITGDMIGAGEGRWRHFCLS